MTLLQAQCAEHPERAAVELCARCGRFLCGDCLELVDDTPYCPSCAERTPSFHATPREKVAMALALAGLLVPPLGAGAILVGRWSLTGSRQQWGRVAVTLGVLEVFASAVLFVTLAVR